MEGNKEIILNEPGPVTKDDLQQNIQGLPREHRRWALRLDRGGSERVIADTSVGNWNTRFEVRKIGIEDLNHTWWIIDEFSREYDIESIVDRFSQWWWIFAVNRT